MGESGERWACGVCGNGLGPKCRDCECDPVPGYLSTTEDMEAVYRALRSGKARIVDAGTDQLPANIVAAVRAYQEAHAAYVDFAMTTLNVDTPDDHPVLVAERRTFKAVYWAIEADAKERG